MPVSTLIWIFSVPPYFTASELYSCAFASQVTACVILKQISRSTCSFGVCPRIRIGIVMP